MRYFIPRPTYDHFRFRKTKGHHSGILLPAYFRLLPTKFHRHVSIQAALALIKNPIGRHLGLIQYYQTTHKAALVDRRGAETFLSTDLSVFKIC